MTKRLLILAALVALGGAARAQTTEAVTINKSTGAVLNTNPSGKFNRGNQIPLLDSAGHLPALGGLTITTTTGTLTIGNGKTLTVGNSIALTAFDGSTLSIGAGFTGTAVTGNQISILGTTDSGNSSIAIGDNSLSDGGGTALGAYAYDNGGGTAIGTGAFDNGGTALGANATDNGGGTALGANAITTNTGVELGTGSYGGTGLAIFAHQIANSTGQITGSLAPWFTSDTGHFTDGTGAFQSTSIFAPASTAVTLTGTQTLTNKSISYGQITGAPTIIPSYAGTFSGSGTATTSFTVTTGHTMANTNYTATVAPLNTLSAAVWYISAKTTTTFTVTYLAGLTGSVSFDWTVTPYN